MSTLITGNFQNAEQVRLALAELDGAGFARTGTASLVVAGLPPAQPATAEESPSATAAPPATTTVEQLESPGDDPAAGGALSGAAIGGAVGIAAGLLTVPFLGPGAAVAGAGAGAYVGSLVGALNKLGDPADPDHRDEQQTPPSSLQRQPGTLIAVTASDAAWQLSAIRILQAHGATDIDAAEGIIDAGQWIDFDATAPLRRVNG
ncbi:hypothetical protein [Nevskia sp.]|uniref:hypothetical protein n=1 Tax=Nevskia sp. TaxID=1929292 RepID=UPI0025DEA35A|nr:hypothetical protein [Nevskia sp.]